jgi:DNA-binding MarR family transcriptional regulator/GNAT superfamily N-acetyltransferase
MKDVLSDHGVVFLGSRLKRLGERMQAGAAKTAASAGVSVQPAYVPFLVALDKQPMTIGQLAQAVGISQPGVTRSIGQLIELDLVQSQTGADQRQRTISLTPAGAAVLARTTLYVMPQIEQAVRTLLGNQTEAFIRQLADIEAALDATPLDVLAGRANPEVLRIREFSDELAPHFHDINAEWINDMFHLEDADRDVLLQPRARIVEAGGVILFVEARGLGIVGTGALLKSDGNGFELAKMGVRKNARGLKVGEFLLKALLERALTLGAEPLYLVSNTKCAAGVHLYEKHGFRHDADIMARYGARYARCNVAMRFDPPAAAS